MCDKKCLPHAGPGQWDFSKRYLFHPHACFACVAPSTFKSCPPAKTQIQRGLHGRETREKNAFWFGLGNPRRPKICSIQFMQNRAWTVSASQCWKILRRSHPGFFQNWFRTDFPGDPGTFTAIKTSASMTSVQQSAACKGYARQFLICALKNQERNPHSLPSNVPNCETHHWIGEHLRPYLLYFVSTRLGSSLRLDYVFPYLGRSAWATMLLMQLT